MPGNPLKGSERQPIPGAKSVGKSDPAERLEVTVLVRRSAADDLQKKVKDNWSQADVLISAVRSLRNGTELLPADMAAVKKFAKKHGLAVVQEDASRRTVVLSGKRGSIQPGIRSRPAAVRVRRWVVSRAHRSGAIAAGIKWCR